MYLCLDILSDQNQKCSDNSQFCSENVQCLTIISSTALVMYYALIIKFAMQQMRDKCLIEPLLKDMSILIYSIKGTYIAKTCFDT